eukprot:NODE_21_length_42443_cov_0.822808.p6 type:complete len:518 gc:universal NODE_21_length_42443_cov_0.822808:40631-39078(-)
MLQLVLTVLFAKSIEETYPDVKLDEGVVQLTKSNFESFLTGINGPVIVEFYAPWCGFCKKLKPEYEAAAKELWEKEKSPLVKVDCTEDKDLCEEFGVQGFPTLKIFNNGKVGTTYEGARTKEGIVDYIVKRKLPAVIEIKKAEEISELKEKYGLLVASLGSSELFHGVADKLRDIATFIAVPEKLSKDSNKALNIEMKKDEVYLVAAFLEKPVSYGKLKDAESLSKWLKPRTLPVLGDVTPENFKQYSDSELPLGFIFYTSESDKEKVKSALSDAANKQWGVVNFGFVDGNEHGDFAESLGLKKEFPAMSIQNLKRQINFPYSGEWKKDQVAKFVEEFASGKLKPHLKSDVVPENEYDEEVRVIVGKSFEDLVLDKSKDVLVELYAPWCGFCKRLAPIWSKLATALKDSREVLTIAKMDATTNDMPLTVEYTVKGFPTILFFRAKDNKLIEYSSGDREAEDFYKFLKENAHFKDKITANEDDLKKDEKDEESEGDGDEESVVDSDEGEDDAQDKEEL